jgi:hypothetical protein
LYDARYVFARDIAVERSCVELRALFTATDDGTSRAAK